MFFNWLKSLGCIVDIRGEGRSIFLSLDHSEIPNDELRELVAIFTRYKVELSQLAQFKNAGNSRWFYENEKAFWHQDVFG